MLEKITSIADLLAGKIAAGSKVTIAGWIRTKRDSKAGFSFLNVHDGSAFAALQVVAANTLENYNSEILHLTSGCSVWVEGEVVESPAAGQKYELKADRIKVYGLIANPEAYPISPKYHTLEYLREVAHLRVRTNTIGAVMRVSNCLSQAIHRFFHEHGFYWIRTPIITSSDCEGAGQMFRVTTLDVAKPPRTENGSVDFREDFFGKESFLTVSGQLNVEGYCEALSKVYTFGPTFRAENSNTSRHLAEFWMIEPEIAFADLKDDARLAEDLLKYVAQAVLAERGDDMNFFVERVAKDAITRLEKLIKSDFTYLEYGEAVEILKCSKKKFEFPVEWGTDLQSEHERYLTEEHVGGPVVVINYPKQLKSFYMRLNDDNKTVAAMDVLVPGIGEIIGGSQREERLDFLERRLDELHLDRKHYEWYLDLRRYGTVPHAGFGMGFERLLVYVTGLTNIRDVIPYPRTPKHAEY
jgi:asparaginyl-tRNA synthetase